MAHDEPSDRQREESGDIEQTVLVPRVSQSGERESTEAAEPDLEMTVVRLVEPAAPTRDGLSDIVTPSRVAPPTRPSTTQQPTKRQPTTRQPTTRQPTTPAPQSPARAHSGAVWSVRVRGTTAVVPLDVPVVIGRRPSAQRVPEHPSPRRIVIPAGRADVSGRHARLEQLGDSLVVTDLGSTNGIVVHWSSGSTLRLRPGESCALLPDAVVVLGEGVELEFLAADGASPAGDNRTSL